MKFYFILAISVLNLKKQFDECSSMKLKENALESQLKYKEMISSMIKFSIFRYGFVIAVTAIDNIGVGKVQPGKRHEKGSLAKFSSSYFRILMQVVATSFSLSNIMQLFFDLSNMKFLKQLFIKWRK